MKKWKEIIAAMIAALIASCSPSPVAAQDTVAAAMGAMETAVDNTEMVYTVDLIPIIFGVGFAIIIYRIIKASWKHYNYNVISGNVVYGDICAGDLNRNGEVLVSIHGNGNCYINNVTINGVRIPDIEVKDKVLYIDGVKKRHLGNKCHIYNRGPGIFVDGKFVA